MNILLLSNSAPNYCHFFNALATRFAKDGANVVVAVDSAFSRKQNNLDRLGFEVFTFSEYFAQHEIDHSILQRYQAFNLNAALLSDFERAEYYNVWGDKTDIAYFDRLKSALLSYFEELFDRHKIDVILYENVSNAFAHFAFFVAQAKGARYCGIGGSRLPGRFSITSDPLADDQPARNFQAIRSGELVVDPAVRAWVDDYLSKFETVVPDYMKTNGLDRVGLVKRYSGKGHLRKLRALLPYAFDNRTDAFQIGNPLWTHLGLFARNLRRRLRVGRVARMYDRPQAGESFLLYPLHFHPEASTSILAGAYLDEYEVIRNIAFNLPEGVRLYVKDHISAWGYPSLYFYKRLARLPNVRLLGPQEPTKDLIKQSAAVITLTSTVGYEALLLKKRVFLYGSVFYQFHKGVARIDNPAQLHEALRQGLSSTTDWDDAYNFDFVCAYYLSTRPGALNLMQNGQEGERLAENLLPQIAAHISSNNQRFINAVEASTLST